MKIQSIKSNISFKSGYPTNPWSGYCYQYPGMVPVEDGKPNGLLHKKDNITFTGHSPVGGRFMILA